MDDSVFLWLTYVCILGPFLTCFWVEAFWNVFVNLDWILGKKMLPPYCYHPRAARTVGITPAAVTASSLDCMNLGAEPAPVRWAGEQRSWGKALPAGCRKPGLR
jgi:hypothetical protein